MKLKGVSDMKLLYTGMSDAFIKNITWDWNRGSQKPIMIEKFGLSPYLNDISELFNNRDAIIFYTERMLSVYKHQRRFDLIKCYESFLLKAQGGE